MESDSAAQERFIILIPRSLTSKKGSMLLWKLPVAWNTEQWYLALRK